MENRLYVGNLSDDVNAELLRERFAEYGGVSDVRLSADEPSRNVRGHAFVTMANAAAAQAAMTHLNGALFEGRPLRVHTAGEDRETARTRPKKAERVRITSQFRERLNMVYELDCVGAEAVFKMFPEEVERTWRVEASIRDAAADSVPVVVTASGPTRAAALEGVVRAWHEPSVQQHPHASIDWAAVTEALSGVRAI